jgi:hypothetical protein
MRQVHVRLSAAHRRRLMETVPHAYAFMDWVRRDLLERTVAGTPPPPNQLKLGQDQWRMSLRLRPDQAAQVKAWAARHNTSIAEAVRGIISNL